MRRLVVVIGLALLDDIVAADDVVTALGGVVGILVGPGLAAVAITGTIARGFAMRQSTATAAAVAAATVTSVVVARGMTSVVVIPGTASPPRIGMMFLGMAR